MVNLLPTICQYNLHAQFCWELPHAVFSKACVYTIGIVQEERVLNQFHYTAWPDHGVPKTVQPIMDMIKTIPRVLAQWRQCCSHALQVCWGSPVLFAISLTVFFFLHQEMKTNILYDTFLKTIGRCVGLQEICHDINQYYDKISGRIATNVSNKSWMMRFIWSISKTCSFAWWRR